MSEFDAISGTAGSSGVPTTLADELKAENDTDFDGGSGPSYDTLGNDINLPDDIFGRLGSDTLRDTDLPSIYNEMWHAFWDQVLETKDKCAWLYRLIVAEAGSLYGGDLDKTDEAMSETIDELIWSLILGKRRGRTPDLSYGKNARAPLHCDPGEKWHGDADAKKKISEDLYDIALYILYFDCAPPDGHDPADHSDDENLSAIKERVAGIDGRQSPEDDEESGGNSGGGQ